MMQEVRDLLAPGELWHKVLRATRRGLAFGSLEPIPTTYETLAQDGAIFFVRMLSDISRKKSLIRKSETRGRPTKDPFLPYDETLFVDELTQTHLCLLNKFNVVEHHLLIVTRAFEGQETLLTIEDFQALCLCMVEYEGLGFYNAGSEAGASQPHKHLQLVPLPLFPDQSGTLVDTLSSGWRGRVGRVPAFPFEHFCARLAPDVWRSPLRAAEVTFRLYRESLLRLGLLGSGQRQKGPYNLLLNRKWIFVVPRSQECFGTISINALGFAGALLVRNSKELETLRTAGPMTALRQVAMPKTEDGFKGRGMG